MPTRRRNIKLTIQYDGTGYAGWQSQTNAVSIQQVIEKTLKRILGEKVTLKAAGRTDSGVHTKGQVANFKTSSALPLKNIRNALNSLLPKDITISGISDMGLKFDSQHHAKSKLYRYTLVTADYVEPFIRDFAVRCKYILDIRTMKREASHLLGRHDFRSFQAKGGPKKDTARTIKKISVEKKGNLVYIDIEADGFLYNMARNIVGTLIEVGRGKFRKGATEEILLKKDRAFSGPTAPAKGLCLVKVKY